MIQLCTTHQKTLFVQSAFKRPLTYATKSRCASMSIQHLQEIYTIANLPNPSLKRIAHHRNTIASFPCLNAVTAYF